MRALKSRSLVPAVIVCLLVAGIYTSVVVVGQTSPPAPTQGQLEALVAAAQTSRAYASSAVDLAASHSLSVSAAQAQLSQGDSLLEAAQADAQSGSNIAAGVHSVQAAMWDYSSAAAAASVALGNAGLAASVDYAAAEGAVAEVNSTASLVATVATQACTGAEVNASNSSGLAQACSEVEVQTVSAVSHLNQAASLLAQPAVNLTQVLSQVAIARAEVDASQSNLVTIASYTYTLRGHAFLTAVVLPLSAKANMTVNSEQSILANLTQFQTTYSVYVQSQATATADVNSSARILAAAISQVDTSSVSSSVSAAQTTSADVSSEMSALLNLPGIASLTSVIADIHACASAAGSYESALGSAESQSSAYAQTQIPSFSGYLSAMESDTSTVQSAGSTYVSSCQSVTNDLSALLLIPGVQAIYNVLIGLQVSGTAGGANTSLQAETSAMATVKADIISTTSTITTSESSILVSSTLITASDMVAGQGAAFLNATGAAALAQASASLGGTAQAAQSFVASANASAHAAIGTFSSSVVTLSTAATSLSAQTKYSLASTATAVGFMNSDIKSRVSEVASGQAEVSQAFQLFASLNVSGGTSAMAQAYLKLQAAASVSA